MPECSWVPWARRRFGPQFGPAWKRLMKAIEQVAHTGKPALAVDRFGVVHVLTTLEREGNDGK